MGLRITRKVRIKARIVRINARIVRIKVRIVRIKVRIVLITVRIVRIKVRIKVRIVRIKVRTIRVIRSPISELVIWISRKHQISGLFGLSGFMHTPFCVLPVYQRTPEVERYCSCYRNTGYNSTFPGGLQWVYLPCHQHLSGISFWWANLVVSCDMDFGVKNGINIQLRTMF
eukprot:sb/3472142/